MKPIVIANWKMNLSLAGRKKLAQDLKKKLSRLSSVDVVVCPSFVSLAHIGELLKKSKIILGAQDVFWEDSGAYTGEISPAVLEDLDCQYVIVGHSERRHNLGETDEMVNKKVKACLEGDLTPIICVGETLEDRRENRADNVVLLQVRKALDGVNLLENDQIVIAYEPIWAIGTGEPIEPQEAEYMFDLIRQNLLDLLPLTKVNNSVRLVYGGSINDKNINEFIGLNLLNGFLVGNASLDIDEFALICRAFK